MLGSGGEYPVDQPNGKFWQDFSFVLHYGL